ncbi:hypothetical protein GCM10009780_45870 [Actinomadura alba]
MQRASTIPGLSPWGRTQLAQIEHRRFWPGATVHALVLWEEFVRHPYHRVWEPLYEQFDPAWDQADFCCGQTPRCFASPTEARRLLGAALCGLPKRDARRFLKHLEAIERDW